MDYAGEPVSRCWCGNSQLETYSPEYLRCPACETLVIARAPDPSWLISLKDESGFYGRSYYEKYLIEEFGFPSLPERARTDLPERCLYWLRTLLRYRLPPGKALEIGSAHGGFVALLRWVGYDATGLEVSPWLVEFAQRTFEVPMLLGPIEQQALEPESFDVIALMDVIEHMPDPAGAMRRCAELLRPGGVVLIQTPCFPEGKTHAQLVEENAPFLKMMVAPNHLFLFSRKSISRLLGEAGLRYVQFEPNLFPYDMYLVAGRDPLAIHPWEQVVQRLEASPGARLVRALFDLDDRYEDLKRRYLEAEADRAARLEVIQRQGAQLGELDAARSRLEQEVQAREVRLAALAASRDTLSQVLARTELALRESQKAQNELHQRIGELSQQLKDMETARRQLEERLEAMEQRHSSIRAERDQLCSVNAQLRDRLETTEAQLKAAITEASSLRSEIENSRQILDRLRRSLVYRAMRILRLWGWLAPVVEATDTASDGQGMLNDKGPLRRVAVDVTPLLPGGENGGAKLMTIELIKHLSRLAPNCEFLLLTSARSHDELAYLDSKNVRRLCVSPRGRGLSVSPASLFSAAASALRRVALARLAQFVERLAWTLRAQAQGGLLHRLGVDLLFCPFTAPFFYEPGIPVVSVVHDLQYRDYPQFFSETERAERDRAFRQACLLASRLVCISEFVRQKVLREGSLDAYRVETIHNTLPNRLRRPPDGALALKKHGLEPESYLLYPANFWPHKNHELLLTAFGMYRSRHPESRLKLVLTGAPGPRMTFLEDASRRMGLAEHVIFAGYVPDEEFAALLYGCRGLIFPSLYEGFGMPLLEAMAAGKPVLASNATSLPEVAGRAAAFFDPRKPREIVACLERLETDPQWSAELVRLGTQRLTEIGDEVSMATRYWALFQAVHAEPPNVRPVLLGVYADGWTKDQVVFRFRGGAEGRRLILELRSPGWLPWPGVNLQMRITAAGRVNVRDSFFLARGQTTTIERVLPGVAGSLQIRVSPVFQPRALGQGQDPRWLGCRVLSAEIHYPDGKKQPLEFVAHGA
jgi:glycosyltransferase involved in cell wall biosynthesis/2-polyprenyl-3-methyl-5-hydroxy-6-metoxy-1,4-benzoquinol methylase